ncbi:hypothetical protein HK101_007908 [Irineochytrium annulatum]|nr:hypothetical protein HK101_007908 [Irineochytrium annulatum]
MPAAARFRSNDVQTTRTSFPATFRNAPPPVTITRKNVHGSHPTIGTRVVAALQDPPPSRPGSENGNGNGNGAIDDKGRRKSLPISLTVNNRRQGWRLDTDLNSGDEATLRRRAGMKNRYMLPDHVQEDATCSGSVLTCRKPLHGDMRLSKWKKRWILIKDNKAYFIKKPKDTEATVIIKLDDCVIDPKNVGDQLHSFSVYPPPGSIGETRKEMLWIIAAPNENFKRDCIAAILESSGWMERMLANSGAVPFITLNPVKTLGSSEIAILAATNNPNIPTDLIEDRLPHTIAASPAKATVSPDDHCDPPSPGTARKSSVVIFPIQSPTRALDLEDATLEEAVRSPNSRFFHNTQRRHSSRRGSLDKAVAAADVPASDASGSSPDSSADSISSVESVEEESNGGGGRGAARPRASVQSRRASMPEARHMPDASTGRRHSQRERDGASSSGASGGPTKEEYAAFMGAMAARRAGEDAKASKGRRKTIGGVQEAPEGTSGGPRSGVVGQAPGPQPKTGRRGSVDSGGEEVRRNSQAAAAAPKKGRRVSIDVVDFSDKKGSLEGREATAASILGWKGRHADAEGRVLVGAEAK